MVAAMLIVALRVKDAVLVVVVAVAMVGVVDGEQSLLVFVSALVLLLAFALGW